MRKAETREPYKEEELFISGGSTPRVLLLGNGINRAYGGASWKKLLDGITNIGYSAEQRQQISKLPPPLQAVVLSGDTIDRELEHLRRSLCEYEIAQRQAGQLRALLELDFDCILTTNYTYELECVADPAFLASDRRRRAYLRHTDAVKNADKKYLLHSYYRIPAAGHTVPVFHIHGEAKKRESMVLGHYYYGNLLCQYIEYLKGVKDGYADVIEKGMSRPVESWIDYFLLGDVYVFGYGMDSSEMDMWWLLCRKKRERTKRGSFRYYEPKQPQFSSKIELMTAYDAKIRHLGMTEDSTMDYREFYDCAIREIGEELRGKGSCGDGDKDD